MKSARAFWRCLLSRSGLLSRFSANVGTAGAVAIITAISAPALLMIVGFASDYGYASYINQRLARATDSGTLGSVSQTAATTAGGYTQTAAMQAIGVNIFNANVADLPSKGVTFNLSVVSDGTGGVIATGSYNCNVSTFFGGILGLNNIPVSGTAKTSARPVVYVNYYILVDTSQSMGIASTQADMNTLYNRVAAAKNGTTSDPGCVFGCHVKGLKQNGQLQPYTNEFLAHDPSNGTPVTLRIDSAVTAIKNIINTASSVAAATQNIRFALYEIQLDPSNNNLLTQVASMSSNYSSLQSAASKIELGNNNQNGKGDSSFPNELDAFNTMLVQAGVTANGNGASATSPLNFIFIITDGLYDIPGNCTYNGRNYGHCTAAFDANNCATLKSKATVGTIYTTYSPIYTGNNPGGKMLDQSYSDLAAQYITPSDQLAVALNACATSSDYAFQATDGPDIIAAMQSLFQRTQPSSARITQ